MSGSNWLVVEAIVKCDGLETAETRIKEEYGQHDGRRQHLLGHARKYADRIGGGD